MLKKALHSHDFLERLLKSKIAYIAYIGVGSIGKFIDRTKNNTENLTGTTTKKILAILAK